MRTETLEEKEAMIKKVSEVFRNADYIDVLWTREILETAPIDKWRCFASGDITVSISSGSKVS